MQWTHSSVPSPVHLVYATPTRGPHSGTPYSTGDLRPVDPLQWTPTGESPQGTPTGDIHTGPPTGDSHICPPQGTLQRGAPQVSAQSEVDTGAPRKRQPTRDSPQSPLHRGPPTRDPYPGKTTEAPQREPATGDPLQTMPSSAEAQDSAGPTSPCPDPPKLRQAEDHPVLGPELTSPCAVKIMSSNAHAQHSNVQPMTSKPDA
jgi:hypothetical protein